MPDTIAVPGATGWLQDDAADEQTATPPAATGWVQTESNTTGPIIVNVVIVT